MRQMISGLFAAIAVMATGAVPALACGGAGGACTPCGPAYVSLCAPAYAPTYGYSGCDRGCWAHARLPDPELQYHHVYRRPQYYFVNQGPTFTGPGAFAPYPTYQESTVFGWEADRRRHRKHVVLRRYY
jgi:hypothetical protein